MKQLIYLGIIIAMVSCSKQDRSYYDFIKNGAIVYTGKADSLKAFSGNERVVLNWVLASDQNITGCKIFWNFKADSLVIPVKKSPRPDTIKVSINNLPEGSYNFEVFTFDKEGHTSIGTETIGNSYGASFQSTLSNRPIRTSTKVTATNSINITWVGKDDKCLGTEWSYTGKDQQMKRYFSAQGDTTLISSCDLTKPVTYRTLFIPEKQAADTFYTDFKAL
jgi:hypothetical protein